MKTRFLTFLLGVSLAFTSAPLPAFAADALTLGPSSGSGYTMIAGQNFSLSANLATSTPGRAGLVKYLLQSSGFGATTQLDMAGSTADTDVTYSYLPTSYVIKSTAGSITSASSSLSIKVNNYSVLSSVNVTAWVDLDGDDQVDLTEITAPQRKITFLPFWKLGFKPIFTEPTTNSGQLFASVSSTNTEVNLSQLENYFSIAFAEISSSYQYSAVGTGTVVSSTGEASSGKPLVWNELNSTLFATVPATTTLGKEYAASLLDVNGNTIWGWINQKVVAPGTTLTGTFKTYSNQALAFQNVRIRTIWNKYTKKSDFLYKNTTTDGSGKYTLTNLPIGDYEVAAWTSTGNGTVNVTTEVSITSSATVSRDLIAPDQNSSAQSFHVFSGNAAAGTLKNLSGFNLTVTAQGSVGPAGNNFNYYADTTSDSSGMATITGIPEGSALVSVSRNNPLLRYIDLVEKPIEISSSDATFETQIQEFPKGNNSVSGDITNTAGVGIGQVEVILMCGFNPLELKGDYKLRYQTFTDDYGGYYFGQLANTNCQINTYSDNYLFRDGSQFTLTGGTAKDYDIVLVANGTATVSGQVTSSVSPFAGVPNIAVDLRTPGESGISWQSTVMTDSNGNYTIPNVPESYFGALEQRFLVSNWDDQTGEEITQPYFQSHYVEKYIDVSRTATTLTSNYSITPIPTGSIILSGIVKNRITNSPISGAKVDLNIDVVDSKKFGHKVLSTVTDANGAYMLSGIIGGQFTTVQISHPTYGAESYSFQLRTDEAARSKNFSLLPNVASVNGGSISGKVTDSLGNGVAYAHIRLQPTDGSDWFADETDSQGNYSFVNLPINTYKLRISKTGFISKIWQPLFKPYMVPIELTSSTKSVTANHQLISRDAGNATVSGRIIDRNTQLGVAGVQIWIFSQNDDVSEISAVTNADGTWSIPDLFDGTYVINYGLYDLEKNYKRIGEQSFTIVGQANEIIPDVVTESLVPGSGKLEINVRDRNTKEFVSDASVQLWALEFDAVSLNAKTNESGRAEFNDLARTSYMASAWGQEIMMSDRVTVEMNNYSKKITLWIDKMSEVGIIEGYVRDANGNPLQDIEVSASYTISFGCCSGEGAYKYSTTDVHGFYRIEKVWLNTELTLAARPDPRDMPSIAPSIFGSIKLSSSRPSVTNKNVKLYPGSTILGNLLDSQSNKPLALNFQAKNATTLESTASGNSSSTGEVNWTGVPSGPTKVMIFDTNSRATGERYMLGYLKQVASSWEVTRSAADATAINLTPGGTLNIGDVKVPVGGSISGTLSIDVGGVTSTQLPRWFRVVAYQKVGNDWISESQQFETWASGASAGQYQIDGLPDGIYKVAFTDEWYEGASIDAVFSGQSNTLVGAQEITVVGGQVTGGVNGTLFVKQPTTPPAKTNLNNLSDLEKKTLKDQVLATKSGGNISINVGKEFAGEWVSIGVETRRVSNASVMRIAAVVNTSDTATSNWVQVGADGNVSVSTDTAIEPGQVLVVQDSNNNVIGWTAVAVVAETYTGGGGGGGGGGGLALPAPVTEIPAATAVPKNSVAPIIKGSFKVGQTIKVSPGIWLATGKVTTKVTWLVCAKPVAKSTKASSPKGCKTVKSTGSTLKISSALKGKYLTVRIAAKSGTKTTYLTPKAATKVK